MVTAYRYRAIVIAPEVYKDALNNAVQDNLDPGGGLHTFELGASASGSSPATHLYANSAFTKQGVQIMKVLADSFPLAHGHVWVANEAGSKQFLDDLCSGIDNITVHDEPQEIDSLLSVLSLQRIQE